MIVRGRGARGRHRRQPRLRRTMPPPPLLLLGVCPPHLLLSELQPTPGSSSISYDSPVKLSSRHKCMDSKTCNIFSSLAESCRGEEGEDGVSGDWAGGHLPGRCGLWALYGADCVHQALGLVGWDAGMRGSACRRPPKKISSRQLQHHLIGDLGGARCRPCFVRIGYLRLATTAALRRCRGTLQLARAGLGLSPSVTPPTFPPCSHHPTLTHSVMRCGGPVSWTCARTSDLHRLSCVMIRACRGMCGGSGCVERRARGAVAASPDLLLTLSCVLSLASSSSPLPPLHQNQKPYHHHHHHHYRTSGLFTVCMAV